MLCGRNVVVVPAPGGHYKGTKAGNARITTCPQWDVDTLPPVADATFHGIKTVYCTSLPFFTEITARSALTINATCRLQPPS